MNKTTKSVTVAVVLAVAALTGAALLVQATRGCHPPRDQTELIEQLKTDPIFAVTPEEGQLAEERFQPAACDPHDRVREDGWPGTTFISRQYRTPTVQDKEQLRRRFDQPATAAGWQLDQRLSNPVSLSGMLVYCKQAGLRRVETFVASTQELGPGVIVNIVAGHAGTMCVK